MPQSAIELREGAEKIAFGYLVCSAVRRRSICGQDAHIARQKAATVLDGRMQRGRTLDLVLQGGRMEAGDDNYAMFEVRRGRGHSAISFASDGAIANPERFA